MIDNRHVELDEPLPLSAGKVRVAVQELTSVLTSNAPAGIGDEDWSDTPEGIEAWIRWYDSLEPVEFTAAERAAWQTARNEDKQTELAWWNERSDRLEEHFR
ncbi:MAG: hypothetical protein L0Y71_10375 [Gemmataceae bacterium]|nr:hypothetical protein [Gemmataceae bacterium]